MIYMAFKSALCFPFVFIPFDQHQGAKCKASTYIYVLPVIESRMAQFLFTSLLGLGYLSMFGTYGVLWMVHLIGGSRAWDF